MVLPSSGGDEKSLFERGLTVIIQIHKISVKCKSPVNPIFSGILKGNLRRDAKLSAVLIDPRLYHAVDVILRLSGGPAHIQSGIQQLFDVAALQKRLKRAGAIL